jgi:hypothetical protein
MVSNGPQQAVGMLKRGEGAPDASGFKLCAAAMSRRSRLHDLGDDVVLSLTSTEPVSDTRPWV